MGQLRQLAAFSAGLYRQRLDVALAGYLRRDTMALLQLRPGRDDPYTLYEDLRRGGPLVPTRFGNLACTSRDVCDAVLRDRRFGVRPEGTGPGPDEMNLSFLEMNPPDHTRLRRLAQPAFSPKQIVAYGPRIERTVSDLLDRAPKRFDLVSTLAAPLPISVITDLLGIPGARTEDFARYGATIGSAIDGIKSLPHALQLQAARAELWTMFEELFALRRVEPADDIISRLVAAEGDQIKPAELLPTCMLLLVAGFETTVNLIGNAVNALLDHPEQWRALCADPEKLAEPAIEETLRWDPPVQRTMRVALEPVELAGKRVTKDQWVIVLIGGANRDPQGWTDPGRFDITREQTADHLSFSSGIHYCVGQPLAKLEAVVALRTLAQRMPGLRRAGAVRRRASNTIRGPRRLPVASV